MERRVRESTGSAREKGADGGKSSSLPSVGSLGSGTMELEPLILCETSLPPNLPNSCCQVSNHTEVYGGKSTKPPLCPHRTLAAQSFILPAGLFSLPACTFCSGFYVHVFRYAITFVLHKSRAPLSSQSCIIFRMVDTRYFIKPLILSQWTSMLSPVFR